MRLEDAYDRVEMLVDSTAEPLTLEETKSHLRIELGFTHDDDLLKALIPAARQQLEELTGRAFMRQKRAMSLGAWPTNECLIVPYPPLISISSSTAIADGSSGAPVCYKDSTRGWNTLSSTAYAVDTISRPGRVCLDYSADWPTEMLYNLNPIKVHFTCGYSTSSTGVPHALRLAMKQVIGHWYEHREQFISGPGAMITEVPGAAMALLDRYRVRTF